MKKRVLYGNANYEEIVSKNGYSDYGFDSSTQPEVDAIIKNHYNGYHFIKPSGEAVYNSVVSG